VLPVGRRNHGRPQQNWSALRRSTGGQQCCSRRRSEPSGRDEALSDELYKQVRQLRKGTTLSFTASLCSFRHGSHNQRLRLRPAEEVDMAASDQLTKLAARAKEAEDRAAAARGKAKLSRISSRALRQGASAEAKADKLRQAADGTRQLANHTRNRHVLVPASNEESSPPGGMTWSARGTNTSQRSARTSMPSARSTTRTGRSGTPRRPKTTPCVRLTKPGSTDRLGD